MIRILIVTCFLASFGGCSTFYDADLREIKFIAQEQQFDVLPDATLLHTRIEVAGWIYIEITSDSDLRAIFEDLYSYTVSAKIIGDDQEIETYPKFVASHNCDGENTSGFILPYKGETFDFNYATEDQQYNLSDPPQLFKIRIVSHQYPIPSRTVVATKWIEVEFSESLINEIVAFESDGGIPSFKVIERK